MLRVEITDLELWAVKELDDAVLSQVSVKFIMNVIFYAVKTFYEYQFNALSLYRGYYFYLLRHRK